MRQIEVKIQKLQGDVNMAKVDLAMLKHEIADIKVTIAKLGDLIDRQEAHYHR